MSNNNFWDDEPYYARDKKSGPESKSNVVTPNTNVRYGVWNKRTFPTAPRPSPLLEEYMAKKNICKDTK